MTSAPRWGLLGYTVAKHGVVGLMRAYANFLAAYNIRVNSVHPAGVNTPMIDNSSAILVEGLAQLDNAGPDMTNALPVQTLEPGHRQRRFLAGVGRRQIRLEFHFQWTPAL